jgi:hypothetical protein
MASAPPPEPFRFPISPMCLYISRASSPSPPFCTHTQLPHAQAPLPPNVVAPVSSLPLELLVDGEVSNPSSLLLSAHGSSLSLSLLQVLPFVAGLRRARSSPLVRRPSSLPLLILITVSPSSPVNTFGPSPCGEKHHPAILRPARPP